MHEESQVILAWRIRERTAVPVRIPPEPLATCVRFGDALAGGHGVAVDTEETPHPGVVGVAGGEALTQRLRPVRPPGGEQAGQHGGAAHHQRPARPPDVEAVRRGVLAGTVLPPRLDAQLLERQPLLDQQRASVDRVIPSHAPSLPCAHDT